MYYIYTHKKKYNIFCFIIFCYKNPFLLSVVAHACNPNVLEAVAGGDPALPTSRKVHACNPQLGGQDRQMKTVG